MGIAGTNWGSSSFRGYRILPDGTTVDDFTAPAGLAALDRAGMAAQMETLALFAIDLNTAR